MCIPVLVHKVRMKSTVQCLRFLVYPEPCRGTCTQGTPEIHNAVFKMCCSVSLYLYTQGTPENHSAVLKMRYSVIPVLVHKVHLKSTVQCLRCAIMYPCTCTQGTYALNSTVQCLRFVVYPAPWRGTSTHGTPEIHSAVFKMCYSVSLHLCTRYALNFTVQCLRCAVVYTDHCRGTCIQSTPEIHSAVFKMCYSVSLHLYTSYAWIPQCSV